MYRLVESQIGKQEIQILTILTPQYTSEVLAPRELGKEQFKFYSVFEGWECNSDWVPVQQVLSCGDILFVL